MLHSSGGVSVIALLQGSRGDVLPAMQLLLNCWENFPTFMAMERCHIITHQCHQDLCTNMFSIARDYSVFQFYYLSTSPVVVLKRGSSSKSFENYPELINRLTSIDLLNGRHSHRNTFLIGNLFSLEIWILAQRLELPCILIHPCVPYFDRDIRDAVLQRYQASFGIINNEKLLTDMRWWLWPTLTDKYDAFKDQLETIMDPLCQRKMTQHHDLSVIITMSPKLMSSSFSVPAHGFVRNLSVTKLENNSFQALLQSIDTAKNSSTFRALVCIDFGSMTTMIENYLQSNEEIYKNNNSFPWIGLFEAVISMAVNNSYHFLILSHGATTIQRYFAQPNDQIIVYEFDICPSNINSLYAKCSTIIHHGGIGSMQTAMMAGIPQSKYCEWFCTFAADFTPSQ